MPSTTIQEPSSSLTRIAASAVAKVVAVNGDVAASLVAAERGASLGASPQEVEASLTRAYLAAVTATGGAAGCAAALPGVGTVAQVGISVAEITGYLELTMLYVLQLCEIRGIPVDDLARRQLLLMTILLGDSGAAFMTKASGRAGGFWGRRIVRGIPMATINRLNRILGPRFITKWGTQQGVLVLGRSLPFGIGAAIGAGGNYAISRGVVAAAKSALGPAPLTWQ